MINRAIEIALSRTPIGSLARVIPGSSELYKNMTWRGPRGANRLWGVFTTEEEARRAIPSGVHPDWDTDDLHGELEGQPSIYASLFWLSQHLRPQATVLDFGGGKGTLYYALAQRGGLPEGVRWTVVEVEAALEAGRRRATQRGATGLQFCATIPTDGVPDVLIASGAIQYTHAELSSFLRAMPPSPSILLNKVALTPGPSFWTLQNLVKSVVPYRMYNREDFLADIDSCGYSLVDEWRVAEIQLDVPLHPHRFVRALTGMALERRTG